MPAEIANEMTPYISYLVYDRFTKSDDSVRQRQCSHETDGAEHSSQWGCSRELSILKSDQLPSRNYATAEGEATETKSVQCPSPDTTVAAGTSSSTELRIKCGVL